VRNDAAADRTIESFPDLTSTTDLKFAFRQLLKNAGFPALDALTLALGIGANTEIDAGHLRDTARPHETQRGSDEVSGFLRALDCPAGFRRVADAAPSPPGLAA